MIEQPVPVSRVWVVLGLSPFPPCPAWDPADRISSSHEFFSRIPNELGRVPRKSNSAPRALGRVGVNVCSYRRPKPRSARKTIPGANSDYALRYSRQRCLRLYPTVYTGMLTKLRFSSFVSALSIRGSSWADADPQPENGRRE